MFLHRKQKTINICEVCKQDILKNGEIIFQHYWDICFNFLTDSSLAESQGVKGFGQSMTRFLETKKYIITTETSQDHLLAIPKTNCFNQFCKYMDGH